MIEPGDSANGMIPVFRLRRMLSHTLSWLQRAYPTVLPSGSGRQSQTDAGFYKTGKTLRPDVVSLEAATTLEITRAANVQDARVVQDAICAYNRSKAGDQQYEPLNVFLRGSRSELVGGLLGSTYWQWLTIDFLWVAEDLRGRGHGGHLVVAAEGEAVRRGCKYAWLDTFSFQAKDFYEKRGYFTFGVLENFPGEHKRYFLRKKLEACNDNTRSR